MNRSDIRTNMRLLLNEESAGFWQDADLNKCIDMACTHVNTIISSVREDYFTQSATFSTIAGTKSYNLPSDCRFVRRIEIYTTTDPGNPNSIFKLDEIKFPRTEAGGPWPFTTNGQPQRYLMVGTHFDLWPIPDGVYNARIFYDVRQTSLADDSSVPTLPEDFHDMIVLWGCSLALLINSEPSAEFIQLFGVRKEELINTLIRRGSDDPKVTEGYLENII